MGKVLDRVRSCQWMLERNVREGSIYGTLNFSLDSSYCVAENRSHIA